MVKYFPDDFKNTKKHVETDQPLCQSLNIKLKGQEFHIYSNLTAKTMLCFRIMVQSQTILQYFTSKRQIFTSSRLISSLILLFFTYTLKRMIRCSKNLGTFASFYISLTRFKLLTDHSPQSTMAHGLVKHLYLLKYHNICGYKN